jgi:hypothetical protein
MHYRLFLYHCEERGCPISAMAAIAVTETAEEISAPCTPRCPHCAQLTTPKGQVADELKLAEALTAMSRASAGGEA